MVGLRLLNLLDCSVLRENCASCLDRFVRLLTAVPFSGENFASCLDRFVPLFTAVPFSGRTVLRVWIDLCDYWTVPFSGENFASCLDRFV